MANIVSNSQYQKEARRIFDELNLPEKQIQEFFITGTIRMPQVNRHYVREVIDELMADKIDTPGDIDIFKALLALIKMSDPDDIEELYKSLDAYLEA